MSDDTRKFPMYGTDDIDRNAIYEHKNEAHNSGTDEAGQVGSSGLLVAREGDQLLGTTGSQLAPLVARRIDVIDKPGGARCMRPSADYNCIDVSCPECTYYRR